MGQDAMHEWGVTDCIFGSDKQTLYSLVRVPIFTSEVPIPNFGIIHFVVF